MNPTADRQVLIVEDDPVSRTAFGLALEQKGYRVVAVPTAEEALACLKNQSPYLILLDLRLPGMNGWEFLAHKRQEPALATIPVVIISASPKTPEAGGIPYLQKPVEDGQLLAAVERFAGRPRPEILVVDDEEEVARMLEFALGYYGLKVRIAAGGEQAAALYREHRDRIAVVLLDVQMPGYDGPQTLVRLRQIDPTVQCCFMCGNTGDYSAEELRSMGAADVLPKPFSSLADVARRLWGVVG